MADPAAELERRLSRALGTHDVHPRDRAVIQDAYATAGSWDDLPDKIRKLVEEIERGPVSDGT